MKRRRSEISSHNYEPPINHISNQVQTTPSLHILNKRLDEAKMECEKQEKEEKEREEEEKRLESLPSSYNRNTFSIIYAHLENVIFILSFLFFKLKPWTANYRRRRRLSVRFFLLLFLLIKLFSFLRQNSAQAVQFLQQDQDQRQQQQQQQQQNQDQLQSAFFEPPQSLVYLHESGSGEGQYPQSNSNFRLSSPDSSSSSSSSSISPSLITAKCWNNYENDNDCKQINVITANNANDQQFDQNNNNDDSLITPIVIFESSSAIEPSNKLPTFLAPPYFSSTFRPDSDNVVLARHRTPPTPNDPAYSATPPAETILSPDFPPETTQRNVYNWQPTTATTHPTYTSQRANNKWRPNNNNNFGDSTQAVTMPATSVFVATPQPKKAPKTTTLGRKCRDENDDDCDEPDDDGDGDDDSDNGNGDNGNDRSNNNRGKFKNKNKSNSLDKTTGNSNDVDNDDSPDDADSNNENKQVGGQDSTAETSNEIGSGDGPRDDNEDDDGDDDSENVSDGSGNSEPTLINQTQKFVEVTPYSTSSSQSYNNENLDSSSSVKPGAEIEVVVHPTLPPTFPITTTSMTSPPNYDNSQDIYSPNYNNNNSYDFQTSTIMPDDTYTSKPVFPTSTSSESSSEDSIKKNLSGSGGDDSGDKSSATTDPNQLAGGGTSTEFDLATFKPIPMPPPVDSQERWSNQGNNNNNNNNNNRFHDLKNNQSTDGSTLESDTNKIADKNKFDPTDAAPIKFDNPWRAQPISKPSFGQQITDQQQSQQEPYSRQRPPSRHRPDLRASSKNHDHLNSPVNPNRIQSDILPTMLLYASIVILVVTALIFVIMAFAFWRRNTARQRALLHKTQQQMLNGSAGPNQVVGSMSHGSQLMANIQQPGLLSTYAPGKGLTMGKVTSSIMRGGENEMDNMIGEEDETNPMLAFGDQSKGNQSLDGSGNNLRDRSQAINNQNNGDVGVRTSSWSTDQDQTTTATTTTTSSGSQKTDLGRGGGEQQTNGGHNQVTNQSRPQYPNSLSDGRQNSSSISDSQCSPDEIRQQTSQPQFPPVDQNYQQHQIHQQGPNFLNSHNQAMSSPHGVGSNLTHGQAIYNQQAHSVIPDGVKLQQQQQQQHLLKNKQQQQQFVASRSVENLARNDGYGLDGGPCEPHGPFQQQQPPYLAQPSQGRLINHQMLPPGQQPNLHGIPPFKPPAMLPPNLNIQRAYLSNSPGAQGTSLDGYNPNQQHINGGNVRLTNGQYPPPQQPLPINSDFTNFSASNANMARVAMNPLATLGRRYPAGMGLNRNIYSEDSSSLMTASPSLARTSSSLSFAFSANNQPSTPSIRAKPIVDASGRVFNDYTQVGYNNGNSNNGAPPVLGRKDRSEAWYV